MNLKCGDMNYKALFFAVLAMFMLVSCDKPKSFPCDITICRSTDADYDSISVYCFETDYMKLREVYLGKINVDTTRISENCNLKESRVGLFKLDSDTMPHYFVIEPGKVKVNLSKDKVVIEGSGSNRALFMFRQSIGKILRVKNSIMAEYHKRIADSTLTITEERSCYARDSILSDSLQRCLVRFLSKDDAAAKIALEQYAPLLRESSWREIEKAKGE